MLNPFFSIAELTMPPIVFDLLSDEYAEKLQQAVGIIWLVRDVAAKQKTVIQSLQEVGIISDTVAEYVMCFTPLFAVLSDLFYPFFGIKEQQFLMPVILFDDIGIGKMQQITVTVFFTHLQRIKDMHRRAVRLDLLSKRCYKVGIKLLLHAFLGYRLHRI